MAMLPAMIAGALFIETSSQVVCRLEGRYAFIFTQAVFEGWSYSRVCGGNRADIEWLSALAHAAGNAGKHDGAGGCGAGDGVA